MKKNIGFFKNDIPLWKVFFLGFAYYIVFSYLVFFVLDFFIPDIKIAQYAGHLDFYTFFWTHDQKSLLKDSAIFEYIKSINPDLGHFFKEVVNYKLTSYKNEKTVFILAFYNLFIFIFWTWWCITSWINSKNTNSAFLKYFSRFIIVNCFLYPLYYFCLSYLFFNAGFTTKYIPENNVSSISKGEEIINTPFLKNSNINTKIYAKGPITVKYPENWHLYKNSNLFINVIHCKKEEECARFIVKKISTQDLKLNFTNLEKWIKLINNKPTILQKKSMVISNKKAYYIKYKTIYRRIPSVIVQLSFQNKNNNYIMEWISPENDISQNFPIFYEMFNYININTY